MVCDNSSDPNYNKTKEIPGVLKLLIQQTCGIKTELFPFLAQNAMFGGKL